MKTNIVWMSLAASLVCSTAANAADGTINFTGNISTAACTVSTASASQTVNLGTVTASTFTGTAGVAVAPTRFTIALSACPDTLTTANIKFDGVANTANSNLLALSSGQTATGVGIGIYESNGSTLIPLQTAAAPISFDATGNASVDYVAKYVSTAASVTAGTANAVTNFTIAYN
ncbi:MULTISPECIES: fimbrial protein [unclassified Pseudomonas]|uniref:fimbrial protein n=1 Tax=unclassified Pseudomonas TaxID=196821 RepID=UPI0011EF082B|nr:MULTISPECIES: fimbrial protein [unclassified Pseudomonas]KAA0945705.1 type 1 fimbrial protein [Pseudomonas sp. ANT_H4]KAA0951554.1 type 1 fimbrial protein [Pseudomonas sp. ANT_H14]